MYGYDAINHHLFHGTNNHDIRYLGKLTPEELRVKFGFEPKRKSSVFTWDGPNVSDWLWITCCLFGSCFLSSAGSRKAFAANFIDDNRVPDVSPGFILLNYEGLNTKDYVTAQLSTRVIERLRYLCLSGPATRCPETMREWGMKFPTISFHVPEMGDALPAFGAIIISLSKTTAMRPYRYNFVNLSTDPLPFQSQPFEAKAQHDAAGKMAAVVSSGVPVLNEIAVSPNSYFFGNCVLKPSEKETKGTYFIHRDYVPEFFYEPRSLTDYIGQSVPVMMRPNDKFKEHVGNNAEMVPVRIVNINDNEHLLAFTRFYELASKKKVFLTRHPRLQAWTEKVALFRYNQGYLAPESFVTSQYGIPYEFGRRL